MFLDNVKES